MELYCEYCGSEILINLKKSHRSLHDHMHKIVVCKSCGKKNFPSVLDLKKEKYE
jgi:RNase P subunit RPR2